jgi:phosphatidylserine/phosphatidylglycerophosphate/cardiolipin synthase-like enzyme
MTDIRTRVDGFVGDKIEDGIRAHHRRRLRRTGWEAALDAPPGTWARRGADPREGNDVQLLVDGAEALPELAAAIDGAESSVRLAGWHFAPDFVLDKSHRTLRQLLADAAERVDVRVLAWAGSPLPLFHPDRGEVRETLERLTGGTRIHGALDARERPMHCHHEKLAIVDGRVAFVGGIDLTSLAGNRFDYSSHPARGSLGWHDASLRLDGPIVADVAAHFALRWHEVTGETLAVPGATDARGGTTVQLVRTVPEHIYDGLPNGEFTILEAYLGALRSAEHLVYLESQFLWSPEIVEVLVAKLEHPPSDDFRLVVLLPARPNNGQDDTRGQIGVLADADGGANRFLACTLYQVGTRPPQAVYVHAKIGIVDDRWATIGSANLNEHSLFNDTEVNVVFDDPALVRSLRERLWTEHLECGLDELERPVVEVVDGLWRPRAEEQLRLVQAGEAPTRRLSRLPHVSRRSRRLLGPLNGLLVDG